MKKIASHVLQIIALIVTIVSGAYITVELNSLWIILALDIALIFIVKKFVTERENNQKGIKTTLWFNILAAVFITANVASAGIAFERPLAIINVLLINIVYIISLQVFSKRLSKI